MLIEDKASDTQLIQELIAEGLHAVTRYQPQSDKVIRMHAQTAMIENGFMHLPDAARWLAQYLHELTSFPNGRYDDRSTRRRSRWTGSSAATAPAPMLGSSNCTGSVPRSVAESRRRAFASASAPRVPSRRSSCFRSSAGRRPPTARSTRRSWTPHRCGAPAGSGSGPTTWAEQQMAGSRLKTACRVDRCSPIG